MVGLSIVVGEHEGQGGSLGIGAGICEVQKK